MTGSSSTRPVKHRLSLTIMMVALMLAAFASGAERAHAVLSQTPASGYPYIYDVNTVYDIAVSGNGEVVYVGGRFINFGNQTRDDLAAFNLSTKEILSWAPTSNQWPEMVKVIGSKLYIGGGFSTVEGESRNGIARFDISNPESPTLDSWNPQVNAQVKDVYESGSTVYLVGGFTTAAGGTVRNRAAAVGGNIAALQSWDPNVNGGVNKIRPYGSNFVLIGQYTTVNGGTPRNNLSMVDSNGTLTSWDPNVNSWITSGEIFDGKLVIAGGFSTVGATSRNRLAQIDLSTGSATSWNPNPSTNPNYLKLYGADQLIAAGGFTTISDSVKNGLTILDTEGDVASWMPNPSSSFGVGANTIGVTGTKVIAGGGFEKFGFGPWTFAKGIAVFEDVEPPTNTQPVTTVGSGQEGQQIVCLPGSWSSPGYNTISYQWAEGDPATGGVPILGATQNTFTIPIGAAGKKYYCSVTAVNFVGSATATSPVVTIASSSTPVTSQPSTPGSGSSSSPKITAKLLNRSLRSVISNGYFTVKLTVDTDDTEAKIKFLAANIGTNLAAAKVTMDRGTKRVKVKLKRRGEKMLRRQYYKRLGYGLSRESVRMSVYGSAGGEKASTRRFWNNMRLR